MSTASALVQIRCWCGAVRAELSGEPVVQFYCHCDDCQTVHGAAYVGVALYPLDALRVTDGDLVASVYRTLPRERCARCATQLFAKVNGQPLVGVKANLLPAGKFQPSFHIRCRHAVLPVVDSLPHYRDVPPEFGGDGERVGW